MRCERKRRQQRSPQTQRRRQDHPDQRYVSPHPANQTDFSLSLGKADQQRTFTCHRRADLVNDYLRVIDYYLCNQSGDQNGAQQYKTFSSKVRLNNDDSDKYIQVTLTAFRSFLCIKRDFVSGEAESEATLFKTLTGENTFSDSIDIYYSNIGLLITTLDGVDLQYSRSQIVYGFEFRDVKERQDFIQSLKEAAEFYCGVSIQSKSEEKTDSTVHGTLSAKSKSRFFAVYSALRVRPFGCAHRMELGINDSYLYELSDLQVINR